MGLVSKYCGNEGCELFRVDNPRHAVRLLKYVSHHYNHDSVLNDVLNLADAFNHLSRLEACVDLCCQAITGGRFDLCSDLIEKLYDRDSLLADSTCSGVVSFCIDLAAQLSKSNNNASLPSSRIKRLRENALFGSSAACLVIPIVLAQSRAEFPSLNHYSKVDFSFLESSKSDFLRINELQRNHSVFLSVSDMKCASNLLKVGASLIDPVVHAYSHKRDKAWTVKLSRARRACSLLAGACDCPETEFWCAAVSIVTSPLRWAFDDNLCIEFLWDVGVLDGFCVSNTIAPRVGLSVGFGLCLKASNQARASCDDFSENFGRALSLLQDYCLSSCPENLISQCQSLSTLAETVWRVLLRGDESVGERLELFRSSLPIKSWSSRDQFPPLKGKAKDVDTNDIFSRAPALHGTWYIGDGLLLPASESIARSVNFCKEMMGTFNRDAVRFIPLASGGINQMIDFLIHRGALSAALRLLAASSAILLCSIVPDTGLISLKDRVQEIFTALIERSLGGTGNGITSKIVDSQHAVSFLLSLPMKLAFKVCHTQKKQMHNSHFAMLNVEAF